MSLIEICPRCGSVGVSVKKSTVSSLPKKEYNLKESKGISACIAKACDVAYFSEKITILLSDVKVPFWYKDDSDNVPICYCCNITRGDIKKAIAKGGKTISAIKKKSEKKRSGKCKKNNPLGKCCQNVFLREITIQMSNDDLKKSDTLKKKKITKATK